MRKLMLWAMMLALVLAAGACTKKTVLTSDPAGQVASNQETSQGYGYDTGPEPEERSLDETAAAAPAPGEEPRSYDNSPYWEQQGQVGSESLSTGREYYFALQVGSFSSPDNAEAFSRTLQSNGFESDIEVVDVGGATQHRVLAMAHGREQDIRDRLMGLGVYDPLILYKSETPPDRYPGTPHVGGSPGVVETSGGAAPGPDLTPSANAAPGSGATNAGPDEYVTLEEAPEPTGTFTYQVGSFSLRANAESLARALETRGFETGVEEGRDDRGTVYTVTATGRGSESEVLARLEQAGIYDPIMLRGQATAAPASYAPPAAPAASGAAEAVQQYSTIVYQVGAFTSRTNAELLRDQLAQNGFDARIEAVNLSGTTHYKVLAGRPGTDADNRARLRQLGIHDPIVRSY